MFEREPVLLLVDWLHIGVLLLVDALVSYYVHY